ncbi:glycine cleavage system protein GcvH [Spelaeicoccus albus]|uniref:Glycine cleavage system H protein n=1 Tax=Spelaeicoccus albus TaxID=1280376 RepID=A0A7Z0D557_9MICO|nr:glycine cleavage system protein GcvH [Spelaeicoccus albus]NYI69016.1 glycine cleavage system H protein [Spelaeicoccus albus]
MSELNYPENLRYTAEHEWVDVTDSATTVRVGITSFAQDSLGDVVFVDPPQTGEEVTSGTACGEIESTKSVSDIYAPLDGTVSAVNDKLEDNPELVNSDPYGDGWLFELTIADATVVESLLSASDYSSQIS